MSFGVTCHLSWTKANTAQCLVPGRSMTLMSRWTSDGASRRNDAKELAMPLVAAVSVGIDVRAPLNWNWPRTPPASWIWRRKSSLWRTSVPTLSVWLPVILVSIPVTLNVSSPRSQGRLGENPTIGSVKPFPMLIRLMPLENSSKLAPGMPTSVELSRPVPVESASLWYFM